MGKIVKFCVSCDEGFAEKFGFCPTCGAQLQSFEMKPVGAEETAAVVEPPFVEEPVPVEPPVAAQFEPEISPEESIPEAPPEPEFLASEASPEAEVAVSETGEPEIEDVVEAHAAGSIAAPAGGNFYESTPTVSYDDPAFSSPDKSYYKKDDNYYVTVIQEKNVKQRNVLLMGAAALMLTLSIGGTVYSLFHKDVDVSAIDSDNLYAFVPVVEDVPTEVEEEKKKDKDDGGGGGGGGKDEKDPASEGRLPNQTRDPIHFRPDVNTPQKDFELKTPAFTEGDRKYPPTNQPYGVPNGQKYSLSNGPGTGGGIGSGSGTGVGSGRGTGNGSGDGSGSGSGDGNGNGSGTGDGDGRTPPPPPATTGVTQKVKIISKPRASYTDAARQNNIQGSVTLRITFLASGQIGGISAVNGLPYGLTDQAIAAARAIRFEPAKRNGVPYTTQATIQYGFTIY